MKKTSRILVIVLIASFAMMLTTPSCNAGEKPKAAANSPAGVIHLTSAEFKEKVFDYSTQKEWKYKGNVPAIIDFYADWCGPCRMVSPILEELQKEYGGKIQVYKINTDNEHEVANAFGIQSLPTLIFIPVEGKPQGVLGAQPKEEINKMILTVLKVTK
jgi:thioredoxin